MNLFIDRMSLRNGTIWEKKVMVIEERFRFWDSVFTQVVVSIWNLARLQKLSWTWIERNFQAQIFVINSVALVAMLVIMELNIDDSRLLVLGNPNCIFYGCMLFFQSGDVAWKAFSSWSNLHLCAFYVGIWGIWWYMCCHVWLIICRGLMVALRHVDFMGC